MFLLMWLRQYIYLSVCPSVCRSKVLDTLAIVDLLRVKLQSSNHQVVLVSGHKAVT